jgi:hypothetical protein
MLAFTCISYEQTKCATTREAAQLYHWDYDPEVKQIEVPDDCEAIYRVYSHSLGIDTFVQTLDEAKAIIRSYHGQARRSIRRWRIPVEGGQLTMF